MTAKTVTRDMTKGSPMKLILGFAVPLVFGLLFQQLYNMADTMIVGQTLGEDALAAVGATGSINFLIVGFCNGLCAGFVIPVAQQFGAGDERALRRYAANAIWLAAAVSVAATATVVLLCRPILRLMQTPENIFEDSYRYILAIFIGIPATVLYNLLAGFIRSLGDSRSPVLILTGAALLNIGLDLLFILQFGWGVAGAAWATVLSQVASAALTLRCIVGSQGMPWHVRPEKLRLHGDVFAAICTIGVPAAAQSAMYNISNIFIQSSMNSFGTSTIAAWGVYGKIDFVFWMTINSLGIAITTFAGQNFGARQYDRVRRGVRVCLAMAAGITLFISVTFYNLAEPLFRLFSQDDAVVAVGIGMMHVLTPVYITYICIEVLAGALRGCGDVRIPTLITVFFVCGLRVLWLTLMVPRYHTIATVELSYPLTWTLASLLFILYYKRGGWLNRCKAAKGLE